MNDFAASVAVWLADYYLLGTLLLLLTLASLALLKQPAHRLAVAKSTFVALFLLAALCALPGWSIVHLLSAEQPRPHESPVAVDHVETGNLPAPVAARTIDDVNAAAPVVPTVAPPHAPFWSTLTWPTIIASVYALGSACVFAWLGLGSLAAHRLVQSATPAPAQLINPIADLTNDNHQHIRLLLSPKIDVAVAIGIRHPAILLPRSLTESSSLLATRHSPLATILAHELAHITNHDLHWLAASRALLVLLWSQPLFWLMRRRMRLDQEALADAAAAELTSRQSYAEQLVAWARNLPPHPAPRLSAAVGLWEGPSQLRQRIALLIDEHFTILRHCSRRWRLGALFMAVVAAFALSAVTIEPSSHAEEANPHAAQPTEDDDVSFVPNTAAAVASSPVRPPRNDYTVPITVSGRAIDQIGNPVHDANIYLAAYIPGYRRMAQTKSDADGKFEFDAAQLPVRSVEKFPDLDHGGFEVFGTADGYAIGWRSMAWFYPLVEHASDPRIESDGRQHYGAKDPIEIELKFSPPQTLRGRIVDELRQPIPDTTLKLVFADANWDQVDFSEERVHPFESPVDEDIPPRVNMRKTDADGRFEFANLPADHRWEIKVSPPERTPRTIFAVTHDGVTTNVKGKDVYKGDFELVFGRPQKVKLRIMYGDTGEPAPGVLIGGNYYEAKFSETTDADGVVEVALPKGTYNLSMLPRISTPYLRSEGEVVVAGEDSQEITTLILLPAAAVDITVTDADNGAPLAGVDVWVNEKVPGSERTHRTGHTHRSWNVEAGRSRLDFPRTKDDGKMRVLLEPGKQRIGVALNNFPAGYEPFEPNGREVELQPGQPQTIAFQLRRSRPVNNRPVTSAPADKEAAAQQPVDIPIIVAKHVMIHAGKIIEWADMERLVTKLPNLELARPGFYFTRGALPEREEEIRTKIWDFRRRQKMVGHIWGSILPRTSNRYDAVRTAADLIPNSDWRVIGTVETVDGLPIDGAQVILAAAVDESIPYKTIDIYLRNEHPRNPLDEIVATSNNSGRFEVYPPPGTPYYVVALHKEGFGLVRSDDFVQSHRVRILPWAHMRGAVRNDTRFEQSANVTLGVPATERWPELEFHYYSEDLGPPLPDGRFEFAFIPPNLKGVLRRSVKGEQGRSYSIPLKQFELNPTETLTADIDPPSDEDIRKFNLINGLPKSQPAENGDSARTSQQPIPGAAAFVDGKVVDELGKPAPSADKTLLRGE